MNFATITETDARVFRVANEVGGEWYKNDWAGQDLLNGQTGGVIRVYPDDTDLRVIDFDGNSNVISEARFSHAPESAVAAYIEAL